jgi:DNA-binding transcriptional regulator YiaG
MIKPCTNSGLAVGAVASDGTRVIVLQEYAPNIGAPFKVTLIDSVRQTVGDKGQVLDTCIPNMAGLLKEVALARSLCDRKFSSKDIRFVRKAVGLRANELASLLGISAEHLSRCENGDRALSVAAEKLLRVIILKRRYDYSSIREKMMSFLDDDQVSSNKRRELRDILVRYNNAIAELETAIFDSKIDSVYDSSEELQFQFKVASFCDRLANDNHSQSDEDEWLRAA